MKTPNENCGPTEGPNWPADYPDCRDLTKEIRGLSNVEQVLLDTADSVMDTKRKVEFGVQQIIFKVGADHASSQRVITY